MTWLAEHAGRKLERRGNPAPRGMTVRAAQAVTQNPAYRSASHSLADDMRWRFMQWRFQWLLLWRLLWRFFGRLFIHQRSHYRFLKILLG